MDAQVAVTEIELTDLPESIDGFDAFDAVRCLVRFRSVPIAWWDLNVVDNRINLRREIRRRLPDLTHMISSELLRARLLREGHVAGPVSGLFIDCGDTHPPDLPITVAVCTRNRTSDLKTCLESLRKVKTDSVEVLVVDNAPDDSSTRKLVNTEFSEFRYIREDKPGLDWARNRAWREASHEVIAYTDDDVVVDPGWVQAIAMTFADCGDIAAMTGLVIPLELDTRAQRDFESYGGFDRGFIRRWVSVMPDDPERARPWGTGQFGTGANMAFRVSAIRKLGGFDPALDVGTVTNGGGDLEMLFRILRDGGVLVYEPRALVRHRHRRDYDGLISQIRNNGVGIVSFFQRTAIAYPAERRRLRQLARWLWIHWYLKRLIRTFGSGVNIPRKLILAEMGGFLSGFGKYRKSRSAAIALGNADGIATAESSARLTQVTPVPVTQSPMAVMKVDLESGLPQVLDTQDVRRTRIFVFSGESYLGKLDISNHGRRIFRAELADSLVDYFGMRLLDPARRIDRKTLWVQGSNEAAQLLGVSQEDPIDSLNDLPAGLSVSVVLATRDRPDELRRCLQALEKQETNRRLEIVVVDNNPESGRTSPVIADFDNVRLLTQSIPGLSYARNTGIVEANGDIIVCVDDDVVVPRDWLEKLLRPFTISGVAAVTGNVLPLTLESRAAVLFERYGGLGRGSQFRLVDRKWMSGFRGQAVPTWELGATANAAFRADIFRSPEVGLFHEALGAGSPTGCSEDTLVFYDILAAGYKIYYQPDAWVWHEHRNNMPALRSQLFNYSKGHVAYHLLVFLKHRDLRSIKRVFVTLPLWRLRQVYRHIRRRLRGAEPDFPLSLVLIEIAGHIVGPFSLIASALRVRRHGRVRRSESENDQPTRKGVKPEVL